MAEARHIVTLGGMHPDDPRIHHTKPSGEVRDWPILHHEVRSHLMRKARGPFHTSYIHTVCGVETLMVKEIAETIAADPKFYERLFCHFCRTMFPIREMRWPDKPRKLRADPEDWQLEQGYYGRQRDGYCIWCLALGDTFHNRAQHNPRTGACTMPGCRCGSGIKERPVIVRPR